MKGTLTINGKTYTPITIDFETYYGPGYSLKQMSTSEYVRDPRFKALGCSVKIGMAKAKWVSAAKIASTLRQLRARRNIAWLAYNTPFDAFIASHHYNIIFDFYIDVLAMVRGTHGHHTRHDLNTIAKMHGLGGKVHGDALAAIKGKRDITKAEEKALGIYALDDAEDTFKLFWKIYPGVSDRELQLIDITTRMFVDPVLLLDTERVESELARERTAKANTVARSAQTLTTLRSRDGFTTALEALGVAVPMKISPKTGKPAPALAKTDAGMRALLAHENPEVQALAQARLAVASSLGETRAVRLLKASESNCRVPVLLRYCGAHTLRWSGDNKMNFQNFAAGGELRKSLLAPPGYVLVTGDAAQIEARLVAWLAGQDDLVQAFTVIPGQPKRDIYKELGVSLFGVPVDQITELQREISKVCRLGLGFGMGPPKLKSTLAKGTRKSPPIYVTDRESERFVRVYRRESSYIVELWATMAGMLEAMLAGAPGRYKVLEYGKGYIRLPDGMFLQYPGLHRRMLKQSDAEGKPLPDRLGVAYLGRAGFEKIYGGLLTENVIQALARSIIADHMVAVAKRYRIVMMSHDEITILAPEKEAQKSLNFLIGCMSVSPSWAKGLPLSAEGKFARYYCK